MAGASDTGSLSSLLAGYSMSNSSASANSDPFVNNAGITFGDAGGVSGVTSDPSDTETQASVPLSGTTGSSTVAYAPAANSFLTTLTSNPLLFVGLIVVGYLVLTHKKNG